MKKYRSISDFTKKYGGYTFISILLASLSSLVGLIPYYTLYDIIEKIIGSSTLQSSYILTVSLVIGISLLIKHLMLFKALDFSHKLAYNTLSDMRTALSEKFLKLPMGVILKKGYGSIKKTFLEDVEDMELIIAHHIPEGIGNLIFVVFVVVLMFIIDFRLALLAMVMVVFGLFFLGRMMFDSQKKMLPYYNSAKKMNDTIIEYVNGMEAIKVFGHTTASFRKYSTSVDEFFNYTMDWYKACWKYMSIYGTLLPGLLTFMLPGAIYFYLQNTLSVATLVLQCMLAMSLGGPLLRLVTLTSALYRVNFESKKILNILNEKELDLTSDESAIKNHDVSYENVRFAYNDSEVVKGVSLHFKENTLNALVGESGAGKSTLAKLLVRFYDIKQGDIKIGGVSIKKISFNTLMKLVSFVSQDNFLFNFSIEENIRIGKPDATKDEVIAACKAAGCHDFIMKLEDGYNTVVGGSGNKLSGGEKQRITIARAIIKDSPIIILDEATSFTDIENEDLIQEALGKLIKGKTVIIIVHRLSSVTEADQIVVMKDGLIDSKGKHEDLLKQSALYQKLWKSFLEVSSWNIGGENA